jgi:hypothetical protein
MKEQNLQKAIERLISDENYSKTLVSNPDSLTKDFGLSGKQITALRPSDTPGMNNGTIRSTSYCCCCTCNFVPHPEEMEEVVE